MTVSVRSPSHCLAWGLTIAILLSSDAPARAAEDPKPELRGSTAGVPRAAPATSQLPDEWTAADIAVGKTECGNLFRDLDVEITYLPPIKEGACGLAQPVELRGFGSHPRVKVDPPATLDCKMVVQLAHWFTSSVQPTAATWLKSQITTIHNVASYYCLKGVDDFSKRRNEHAKANAIDISGFTTSAGTTISVGQSWGPTLRGLLATPVPPNVTPAAPSGAMAAVGTPSTDPGLQVAQSGKGAAAIRAARLAEAAKRGIVLPKPSTPDGIFLHAVHDTACNVFGTVLSPEANNDHNEHFHLDMPQRPSSSYCE